MVGVGSATLSLMLPGGLASEKDYPFQGTMEPQECLAKKYQKVAWIQDFFMLPANEDSEQGAGARRGWTTGTGSICGPRVPQRVNPLSSGIAQHLATHGPITVTINKKLLMVSRGGEWGGSPRGPPHAPCFRPAPLQQYKNGVIQATHAQCNPEMADHSVLLVGFGRTEKEEEEEGKQESRPRPHSSIPYWILKNSWGESWGERVSGTCGGGAGHRPATPPGLTLLPASRRAISGCTEGATRVASPSTQSQHAWTCELRRPRSPALREPTCRMPLTLACPLHPT